MPYTVYSVEKRPVSGQILGQNTPDHIESLGENGHIKIFLGGMDVEHAGGNARAVEALARENISVARAIADTVLHLEALVFQRADHRLVHKAVGIGLVRRAEMVDINIDGGAEFRGGVLAGLDDQVDLLLDLGLGMGADLAGEGHFVGDDVGGAAALDAANVRDRKSVV